MQYYFPPAIRVEREAVFYTFKQESLHEDEFIARFLELSKYSTYLQEHHNPKWMCEQLLEKAKPELRIALAPLKIEDFEKLCTELCITARRMREEEAEKRKESQDKYASFMRPIGGVSKRNSYSTGGSSKRPQQPPRSQFNGPPRNQFNGPPRNQYRKPGHVARFCETDSSGAHENRNIVSGRVFAMTQQEANRAPNLIKGTLKLQGSEIEALFDSGVTHSFVSDNCVMRLK
ncbi:uncharacterized protein LOC114761452 [Neltuma alba]|uniref:uncharacterized protein LOC114761452 n=1 Tax=Neltuma alba TaxID=207710 RepID=UPI0010A519A3|nr:uncharacterized protein LOC114761452 [Prosopis alba]